MKGIDLNCDLGESLGACKMGFDEEVMKYITSANVACGWHGGDPMVMSQTIQLAKGNKVSVGAHPGYPDLMGFGRRSIDCTYDELKSYIIYQVGALEGFCKIHGVKMTHVKPHGKMYLDAFEKIHQAQAIAEAIVSYNPNLFYVAFAGVKGELMTKVAKEMRLKVVYEAFPDRAYTPEGDLVGRSQTGAVIKDPQEVAERALLMAKEHKVIAIDGKSIEIDAQTLCVHGDTPTAVDLVKTIREVLKKNRIDVSPMASLI
jgi:UPF0271 protein